MGVEVAPVLHRHASSSAQTEEQGDNMVSKPQTDPQSSLSALRVTFSDQTMKMDLSKPLIHRF